MRVSMEGTRPQRIVPEPAGLLLSCNTTVRKKKEKGKYYQKGITPTTWHLFFLKYQKGAPG
jgi:hypothetical protein